MILFELGGLPVGYEAAVEFNQSYRDIGGFTIRRALNGAGELQQHWRKLATTLSGSGNLPAGLGALDYSAPMLLKCGAPKASASASNVIAIPAARRSDASYTPLGWALFDQAWVPTPVSMATDTATLTVVAGAIFYQVMWFPQITVLAVLTSEGDMRLARYRWQIDAEEV